MVTMKNQTLRRPRPGVELTNIDALIVSNHEVGSHNQISHSTLSTQMLSGFSSIHASHQAVCTYSPFPTLIGSRIALGRYHYTSGYLLCRLRHDHVRQRHKYASGCRGGIGGLQFDRVRANHHTTRVQTPA